MTTARRRRSQAPTLAVDLLRFTDGAVVDPATCPRRIHARSHWNHDGSQCLCPDPAAQIRGNRDMERTT